MTDYLLRHNKLLANFLTKTMARKQWLENAERK